MIRAWTAALLASLTASAATTTVPAAVPAAAPAAASARSDRLRVGVYYFPGWRGGAQDDSWKPITAFNDRQPAIGWYDSGSTAVMTRQLDQMRRHGIDYVAFDWFWDGDHVHADQAVRAYLQVPQSDVSFSLLWANDKPFTQDQWHAIVQFWIDHYFRSPKYLRVNGKPVVFVLTYQGMAQNAATQKTTVAAYVATAQRMARAAGLPGLYMVADLDDLSTALADEEAVKAGFSAVSAYNMHRGPWRGERPGWFKLTQGYPALDRAYRQNWAEAFRGPLDVVVPMVSGWDRRPWGGSADPLHDRSIATPAQFGQHLAAARATMLAHGAKSRLGVICCWNEFGEGSFIEPTVGEGDAKLRQIARVFGQRRN